MPTIDTHAHIFPTLRERVGDAGVLGHTVDEWLQKVQLPAGFGLLKDKWRRWAETLEEKGKTLDIEALGRLQARFHPQLFGAVESVASAVLGPKQLIQGSVTNLLASMAKHGIDKTVVIASGPYCPNSWLLQAAAAHPELIAVATRPDLSPEADLSAYESAVAGLFSQGARGLKIHTNFDNLPAAHPAYESFFRQADARKAFIILHTGCFHVPLYKNQKTPPLEDFVPYFERFPNVRVCLAHMGREHPETVWNLMRRFPQLYTDTSWQSSSVIKQAASVVDSHRILLGSDWPLLHVELQGDVVRQLENALTGDELERVRYRNARDFLGEV